MPSQKRWQLFPEQQETAQKLSQHLNVSPVVAQILLNRQLTSLSEVKDFLGTASVVDNYQLNEDSLQQSWEYVQSAIQAKQRILIYGDYDVDGMTSTAMMVACLRALGADVMYYIPDRFSEGYGLNINCVQLIQEHHVGLLITLDCGVTSVTEITAIKSQTTANVIVMDHHTIPDEIPPFDVMVNPKQLSENHYLSGLCTAGIVYFWVKYGRDTKKMTLDLTWFLCLAAVGTVADVAPLTMGNRVLVREGLNAIVGGNHLGIQTLLEVADVDRRLVNSRDIGFVIAPRLNASGRLSTAKLGVQLLLASSKEQALQVAKQLEKLNFDRRAIDQSMLVEASALAKEVEAPILALYNPNWHPGVIGITASKLVDQFAKPAVLMTKENGIIRGSARSSGSVNIYQVLKQCQSHFDSFGGHKEAAGFSLQEEQYDAFHHQLVQVATNTITAQELTPILPVDTQLSETDMSMELAHELTMLDPFGHGNDQPVFYTTELYPMDFKAVGDGRHLKVTFRSKCGRKVIGGIGFGLAEIGLPLVQQDRPLSVAYHLTINEWRGEKKLQLQLLDMQ